MSSFGGGVSLIRDGRLWPSASAIGDAGSAAGCHLLVVEGYSRSKADVPNQSHIMSRPFRVGGYLWFLKYYPNGFSEGYADFLSFSLILAQDVAGTVKAKYEFSFINQAKKQEQGRQFHQANKYDFSVKYKGICFAEFIRRDTFEISEHLKDDSFTIRFDLLVIEEEEEEDDNTKQGKGAALPFVAVPPPDIQRHFTHLLMDEEGADVTFSVGGETFAAHRCILAARSRVFKAELFGPMQEGTVTSGAILVEDMDARVFRAMLAFIYGDSEPELGKEGDEDAMCQWQQLLVAADIYDLQRLKIMCEDKLCAFIDVNTTTSILALAECQGCDGMKKACHDFLAAPGNVNTHVATVTDGWPRPSD